MSYNRFRSNNQTRTFQRRASRFIENKALVIGIGDSGLAPSRFEGGLALPYASCMVETNAGKRYVVRVSGQQAPILKNVQIGQEIGYAGKFVFGREVQGTYRGGYFAASHVEVTNEQISKYVTDLQAATEQLDSQE